MRFQTAHCVGISDFLLLVNSHSALTSIGQKGGLLTLAFRTNICHVTVCVSHLDELGLDPEGKKYLDEFTCKR